MTRRFAAYQIPISIALLFTWTGETAWRLPGDACYDLKNYHLYGPFALLHGKWGLDLAPGQTQGFLPPSNDLFYYLLARHVGDVRWLNLVLALPACIALTLAFLITLRLVGSNGPTERLVALIAVVISASGAATHPVLATSMSDMIPCDLILGAVLLLLLPRPTSDLATVDLPTGRSAGGPGLLTGAALALKLTVSTARPGLLAALLVGSDVGLRVRLRFVVGFCAAVGLAALVVDGWWWWRLWRFSGNPVFPLYNDIFRSPLVPAVNFADTRFFPRDWQQWLFYPVFWALDRTPLVTEPDQPMCDPRIALGLLAALRCSSAPQAARRSAAPSTVSSASS